MIRNPNGQNENDSNSASAWPTYDAEQRKYMMLSKFRITFWKKCWNFFQHDRGLFYWINDLNWNRLNNQMSVFIILEPFFYYVSRLVIS